MSLELRSGCHSNDDNPALKLGKYIKKNSKTLYIEYIFNFNRNIMVDERTKFSWGMWVTKFTIYSSSRMCITKVLGHTV